MASEGPRYGSAAATLGDGAVAWNNLGNLYADDGSGCNVILSTGQLSDTLRIDGFGFAIPTGATVNGITVTMERYVGVGGNSDRLDYLQLTKTGLGVGNDYADTLVDWSTPTPEVKSFGGVADLWGQSWTPAEINASTFGVRLRARCVTSGGSDTCVLDYVTITITYTLGDSDPQVVAATVPLSLRSRPRWAARRQVFEHFPELVPDVPDNGPQVVRGGFRLPPPIFARSRVIGAADDFEPDSTPGWESSVIHARGRGHAAPRRRSVAVLLAAPEGQGSVCCCPFGAVVVSRRFATADLVAVATRGEQRNTAVIVTSQFATAILIENTCSC
jgi:hypothetical protein